MDGLLNPIRRLVALASMTLMGACATVWVDAEGNRHVVGLVRMTLSPPYGLVAAETLRVRAFGLSWTHADAGNALLLGYGDTTLGFLRNNVCVAPDLTRWEVPQ